MLKFGAYALEQADGAHPSRLVRLTFTLDMLAAAIGVVVNLLLARTARGAVVRKVGRASLAGAVSAAYVWGLFILLHGAH